MSRKMIIGILLGVLGIILICIGIVTFNLFESNKIVVYYCTISNNKEAEDVLGGSEEYHFTVDLKKNEILSFNHDTLKFYENEKTFKEASEEITILLENSSDSNTEYIFFDKNLSINQSVKEILNEKTIDYSKKNWLDDYVIGIEKLGYSCALTKNKK